MNALFTAALLVAPTLLASAPGLAAELPDLGGREVVVVTENAYPPLQFVDPRTGEAIGWEYDAMAELAERLNFSLEIENASWDAMIPAVSEGQYDIGMTGITIREDRAEMVDFSAPYMRSEMFMLVRAEEDRFSSGEEFAALEDGLVGAQAGTTPFYTAVYEVLDGDERNPRIKLFETFGTQVQALRVGDVDLVLTDGTAGEGYVKANPDTFKLIGEAMGTEEFGFIGKASWKPLRSRRGGNKARPSSRAVYSYSVILYNASRGEACVQIPVPTERGAA